MSETIGEFIGTGLEIAVIGMAGRFPGARNIDEFWDNLKNGVESIPFFSDDELKESGIDVSINNHPQFVKTSGGSLEDKEYFDASFFDYSYREAEVMNLQTRMFHECVWEVLENAAYDPLSYDGLIGLYAGAVSSYDWKRMLTCLDESEPLQVNDMVLAESDIMTLHVSYKLNLTGPSITLQTTCSSSLVAVDAACRALLTGQCNMALAGGVALYLPGKKGYVYQEGMINSADGHCRAFAAEATGTVDGEGVGAVVLKLLEDAVADRDYIYAVIKGSACNNDGYRKVSFTAPGVKGQVEVIKTALQMAEVEPESIGYIEAHGTGTILGDPIEVEALKEAFNTEKKGYCALGSVKSNVGHLAAAAGVAGLIKTVLVLKNRLIPPSLHFQTPNPKIDLDNSPFYVNAKQKKWTNGKYPLRAGVSSFGFGGTNAHVVLEEWPNAHVEERREQDTQGQVQYQLLVLSAKAPTALEKITLSLVEYLKKNPMVSLPHAAYTLQVGRRAFPYRRTAVGANAAEIIEALESCQENGERKGIAPVANEKPSVVFMFPGQGAQYVNMGRELYQSQPVFRREMDRCFEILKPLMGYDIKEILYPGISLSQVSQVSRVSGGNSKDHIATRTKSREGCVETPLIGSPRRGVNQTQITQPLLFAFEYGLARLLIEWGIEPQALIGHSIGEYTAACLAGVLSLEDALKLVVLRGSLMQKMARGAMLSVPLGEEKLVSLLKGKELSLAAINAPSRCVVSGTDGVIETFAEELKQEGYDSRRLHTSHAFHSTMMDPMIKEFEKQAGEVRLEPPGIPYISNITGNWITGEEAVSPGYWGRQLRKTVRFADGIKKLLKEETVFIEVGPGNVLSTFARQQSLPGKEDEPLVINLIRHPNKEISDIYHLLDGIGKLWLWGVKIDWVKFSGEKKFYRVPLPTYPFERQRYWPDSQPGEKRYEKTASGRADKYKPGDISHWFYLPSWKLFPLLKNIASTKTGQFSGYLLVFIDNTGLGANLIDKLKVENFKIITVRAGKKFARKGSDTLAYTIDPGKKSDYDRLFDQLKELKIDKIIHLWNVTGNHPPGDLFLEGINDIQHLGLYSLLYIARALGKRGGGGKDNITLKAVSNHIHGVTGEEVLFPAKATVLGAIKTIPQEYSNLRCQIIDIDYPGVKTAGRKRKGEYKYIHHLYLEILADSPHMVVAHRGDNRWVRFLEPVTLEKSPSLPSCIKEKGVYLITGGLGGMGLVFAGYLARRFRAKLILVGRSAFPGKHRWQEWLDTHDKADAVGIKIKKIKELEKAGSEVLITRADVSNLEQVKRVISLAIDCFGEINGIIHAAGIADEAGMIHKRSKERTQKVLAAKLAGTLILDHFTKDCPLDFFILCSSLSSISGSFAQVGYSSANSFLDAFAYYKTQQTQSASEPGPLFVSINWDSWSEVGMSVNSLKKYAANGHLPGSEAALKEGILSSEGIDILERVLNAGLPQAAVCTTELVPTEGNWFQSPDLPDPLDNPGIQAESTGYLGPSSEIEEQLLDIWQKHLGVKQIKKNKDFYELGGDSLKAMTLVGQIHKQFKVEITIPEFLNQPTITAIAQLIDKTKKGSHPPIKPSGKEAGSPGPAAQDRLLTPPDEKTLARIRESNPGIEAIYPLTPLQQQVVSYNLFTSGSGSNWQQHSWMIEGDLDIFSFRKAWETVIQRHSILRTAFKWKRLKEPVQVVYPSMEIPFQQLDCSRMSGEQQKRAIQDYIDRDKTRGFKISEVPLIRFCLISLNNGSCRFTWSSSTSLFDNWSLTIILKEVFQYYDYYTKKTKKADLPEKPQPFAHYVTWLMKQDQSRFKQFWQSELAGFNASMNLGIPRLSQVYINKNFEPARRIIRFKPREVKRINSFIKKHRLTLGTLIQGTWVMVLSYFSGEQDILSGVMTYGRPPEIDGIESIAGLFIHVLPLRINVDDDWEAVPWLRELQDKQTRLHHFGFVSVENIAAWGRVPLEKIQAAVYERTIVMLKSPEDELVLRLSENSTIKISRFHHSMRLNIPLRVYVDPSDNGNITIKVCYDRDVFPPGWVDDMANYWETLVSTVVEKPGMPLADMKEYKN